MATAQLGTLVRHIKGLAAGRAGRHGTDRQLLDDFASRRDEAAFATLVERHGPMVLRVCRRVLRHEQDAEDAFQATFLVLARSSGSIRKREALASWLYGVAYRTAMKAKRGAARRRNHEARLQDRGHPAAPSPTWDNVQAVLDEELQRLPEMLRSAFVLCILDGKTVPAAAAELGVKEGTLSWRLARARQRLRHRLARRGIQLSAVLAALSLVPGSSKATVPATLASTTVRFGLSVVAGEPAAGTIPTHVAALAAGVTRTMSTGTVKIATAVLLAIGLVGAGAGFLARRTLAAGAASAESPRPSPAPAKPQAAEDQGAIGFGGRVVGPDGRPVAGAKLYLTLAWSYILRPAPSPVRATAGEDGRFHFTAPKGRYGEYVGDYFAVVVATAPGFGAAWVEVNPAAAKDKLELRLVKDDVPLNGRVVDLQGRPVPGVTVRVLYLLASEKEDLGGWAEAAKAGKEGGHQLEKQFLPRQLMSPEIPALPKAATTDADGRFRLTGIGRERMAVLQIEGPTIATRQVRAVTRAGATVEVPEWKPTPEPGLSRPAVMPYYGATFTHAAAPTKPIVGVIRDKDTHKPLAGVTVQSYKLAHNSLHGIDFIETKTDAEGRYRLTGMPKGPDNKIVVVPRDDQPYVKAQAVVPDSDGLTPVTLDFALKRGVWIEGRVTNKATGKPGSRWVNLHYFSMSNNPNLRDYPGFETLHYGKPSYRVKEDGSYRIVGLPGPGLLAAQVGDYYLLASQRDDAEGSKTEIVNTAPSAVFAPSYNALTPVNPPRGAESFHRDVTFDPGWTFTGTVVGPDGKPLEGVRSFGLTGWAGWAEGAMKTPDFKVRGYNPRRPRELFFQHAAKGLVGAAPAPKADGAAVTVRMEHGATVTGRLVDADGQARAGVELEVRFRRKGKGVLHDYSPARVKTDKEGRFRIAALLPGCEYHLTDSRGYLEFGGALLPGQTKDLGDVRMKRRGE